METEPEVVVLCGGLSAEAEVSRVSGAHVAEALKGRCAVRLLELSCNEIPDTLEARRQVVFSTLHGGFGEDGRAQAQLEALGLCYAGCDARASALCMDKMQARECAGAVGYRLAGALAFEASARPCAQEVIQKLGTQLVLKPIAEGSSVGLQILDNQEDLAQALHAELSGGWMLEQRITGREMSVGVLSGKALGLVEVVPQGGVYDYAHKYTAGATAYHAPAVVEEPLAQRARALAEAFCTAAGVRDFARVDFFLDDLGQCWFLETNTLPGLTPTSLLPKSAACCGYGYVELLHAMIQPALKRWRDKFLDHGN